MRIMIKGNFGEKGVITSVDGILITLVERDIPKKELMGKEYWIWDKQEMMYRRG